MKYYCFDLDNTLILYKNLTFNEKIKTILKKLKENDNKIFLISFNTNPQVTIKYYFNTIDYKEYIDEIIYCINSNGYTLRKKSDMIKEVIQLYNIQDIDQIEFYDDYDKNIIEVKENIKCKCFKVTKQYGIIPYFHKYLDRYWL